MVQVTDNFQNRIPLGAFYQVERRKIERRQIPDRRRSFRVENRRKRLRRQEDRLKANANMRCYTCNAKLIHDLEKEKGFCSECSQAKNSFMEELLR